MNKPVFEKDINLSRRSFIVGSAAMAGGGLALGLSVPFSAAYAEGTPAGATQVNLWVAIKPDDTCVIRVARSEMGQGTLTGLAQLVAEELECDWSKVTTQGVTPGENLASKRAWGEMGTGGSRGIRTSQDYVRRGGAAARIMLMQAAADQWGVPVSELKVSKGVITHATSQRSLRYGDVAAAAGKLTPPDAKTITLKDPKTWTIAGKPLKRLDTADKLDGSKIFAIDVKLPGMLCAAIKDCPVYGGKLKSYDEAKILGMPGVKKVVRVKETAVAVVADTWWRAKKALDALPIVWDEGPNATQSSATIAALLSEGLTATATNGERKNGDALKAIADAPKKVEAVYATPFLAHAPLEMMNCTVKLSADRADAWVPTQNLEASLAALSESSGVPLGKCEIHRLDLGGGFGRRGGTQDYVHQAAEIAKSFPDTPVKLIWTREEDQAHDFYRPISQCKLSAGLDNDGNLVGLACPRLRPVDQRDRQPERDRQWQGHAAVAGLLRYARRCAAGLRRAQPVDRICHAQQPCAGRPVARRQYQPERRLHGMLHGRGGARGRQRTRSNSAVRSCRTIPSISLCSTRQPRRAIGASRCLRASIAASRSSWAMAAIRRRWPKSR